MQTLTLTEEQKQALAKGHAFGCARCLPVAIRYRGEIDEAIRTRTLPDEVATKIRAQLCRVGAGIFDRIMGVMP